VEFLFSLTLSSVNQLTPPWTDKKRGRSGLFEGDQLTGNKTLAIRQACGKEKALFP
jgi:hypothetical protein